MLYNGTTYSAPEITMRAAEGRRRYGILAFDQGGTLDAQGAETDLGWDFNSQLLFQRGDPVTGTFHLMFRKDENVPIDRLYFTRKDTGANIASIDLNTDNSTGWISQAEMDAATARTTLDDDANWLPVSGHQIRINIRELVLADGTTRSADKDYAYLSDGNGNVISGGVVTLITGANGKVSFNVRAGPLINQCQTIRLRAVDLTQMAP